MFNNNIINVPELHLDDSVLLSLIFKYSIFLSTVRSTLQLLTTKYLYSTYLQEEFVKILTPLFGNMEALRPKL
jgi:hypothetical protein